MARPKKPPVPAAAPLPRPSRPAAGGSRRTVALTLAAVIIALVGAGVVWWMRRGPAFDLAPNADRNVLLVTIDTLRGDALSSYGGLAQTPNLDRLAAHGARFSFAHSHAVVTLVSHATILTGRYPYEHGVRDNAGYRLPAGTATMATRLKAAGFATGAFVGGFPLTSRFGLSPGFDTYDDRVGETTGPVDFALPERRADVVVDHALSWISGQTSRFFGWVHVFDPHAPYQPPDQWLAQYRDHPYYGEVAWTDHALGPLFERLKTLARPTLVIVTADHGEGLGEHGEATHGLFAYESTLHVPLIVAEIAPGRSDPAGVVVDAPARHIDLLPTVLASLGLQADGSLVGAPLQTLLHGGGGDRPEYFEAMSGNVTRGWAPLRGVLAGREKFIDLPIQEFYDLSTDPAEQQNRAPANPPRLQVLFNTLRTYNLDAPGRPVRENAAVAEQLRALGYVSGTSSAPRDRYTEEDDPKRLIDLTQQLHAATDLYERGRFDEAIAVFKQVLARRPDTADAYKHLAFVYWQSGQPAEAITTLETALKLGVKDHEVPLRLGLYLAQTGDGRRAVALLEKLPPDDVEVLNALGIAYSQAGNPSAAMKTFRDATTLDPNSGRAYQNMATVELSAALDPRQPAVARAAGLARAEAQLRKAIDVDPGLADAYTTLGVVLSNTGRRPEAIDAWTRAVALDARNFDALYNLTTQLAASGRREEAAFFARKFLATAPRARFAGEIAEIQRLVPGGNMPGR